MQEFYKKSLLYLIALLIVDALLAALFIFLSHPTYSLSPVLRNGTRWEPVAVSDSIMGGTSTSKLRESAPGSVAFDYRLTKVGKYPFIGARFIAKDAKGEQATVDLRGYDTITFVARCSPAYPLTLGITAFDDKVSVKGDLYTHRPTSTFFSCNEQGVPVTIDLRRLTVAGWWLSVMKLPISSQDYQLGKVAVISFGSSPQTPFDVDSHVEFSNIKLQGRDYRYIVALAVILAMSCVLFGFWFFRTHTRTLAASLNSRLKKDLPLVAYRELTVQPYRDEEKASVLKFIATNYTNPELDLESVVAGTGANRNKVNDLLKTELGMTFTGYVNKLRLTEAARLLTEKSTATVAEIAYSVGYANVSYFNRLFKEEYGCTPKSFRTLAPDAASAATEPPPKMVGNG
ncbi:AraC family transcriptional regulator [Telluria mixta]|uniref:AraC family transcriptional regulator n=1 Tax=Telluria mixta TaxID=34071 RepID=A0ABT2C104_9BURK|nr:AraC family transcriptional regulator [Telluria mixta]MCS0631060.1 AraC family transcriptional regulator [Telluria mixta]WEM95604.1 AraC family transcriptional regulator [Telluria mixta]